jgi:molecular chaperone GrpE
LLNKGLTRGKIDVSVYIEGNSGTNSTQINQEVIGDYIAQLQQIHQGETTELLKMAIRLPDALKTEKEDLKEEEITATEELNQTTDNQDTVDEVVKDEPTSEELIKIEKDKFLRLFAEFENYKKRTTRERIELFKTAGQEVMTSLLPVVDDFERALSHIDDDKEAEELRKGVLLIYQKFYKTLEQKGLSKIETNPGDTFDAEFHEAITQIPAPTDDLKGKVIDCIEKGYKLGDKIIRYPKVVIGQ